MTTDDRGYEIPDDWSVFGTHAVLKPVPDLEFSKQKDETGEPLFERRVCPDKGVCWHTCFDRPCFRVVSCGPLSYYGEDWTDEDKRANGVEVYDLPSMTVDALLRAIFKEQERLYPDNDPGDLTIDVQDDMPMVTVGQAGWAEAEPHTLYLPTMGHSVHEALCKYLSGITEGRIVRTDAKG